MENKTSLKNFRTSNSGFTLIELIVVIVILGIMAAIAGPKFVDLQSDARAAVVSGVEGSLRSAATLVYSKALIEGKETAAAEDVSISGVDVDIVFGYPAATATGIDRAIDLAGDITAGDTDPRVFTVQTDCTATYNEAADADTPASVTTDITGC